MLASPVPAWADEDGVGAETVTPTGGDVDPSDAGAGSGSSGSADGASQPVTTVGNGRTGEPDTGSAPPSGEGLKPLNTGDGKPKSKINGFVIPVPRIPTPEEFAKPGIVPPTAFIGSLEVPTLDQILRAMAQPEPEPAPPGPAFRTQQEDAPPVVDAVGNDSGGDGVAGAGVPVFEAPVVVAPPAAPPVGVRLGPRAQATPTPPITAGAQPAAAGVRAPLIRGTLPPSKVTPPNSTSPLSNGTTAQAGYPRYLRNPTVGELAAVALPGVAGLLFLTFSGGVIGYRQANSTRFVRAGAARFLP
ncbi:hypothetical protein N4S67_24035 [Mycobacterium sp. CPCC 205710]|uniref:Uncharacterized protein n=2 Tax=Mycobacterium deserti TaxID=2978347 RepID=A0ABT2MGS1_9MYCO|nr:hypothetical protein [Mycobacterium deserti]